MLQAVVRVSSRVFIFIGFFGLAACGGGGAGPLGPSATVPPPPPPPSLVNLSDVQTFETVAAHRHLVFAPVPSLRSGLHPLGSALTITIDPNSNTYTIAINAPDAGHSGALEHPPTEFKETSTVQPDGVTFEQNASQSLAPGYQSLTVLQDAVSIRRMKNGEADELLVFIRPGNGLSSFTYSTLGYWERFSETFPSLGAPAYQAAFFVTGLPTDVDDMPNTGQATYTGVVAAMFHAENGGMLNGNGTLNVNFSDSSVTAGVDFFKAVDSTPVGRLDGTGSLVAGTNRFSGDASATINGNPLSGEFEGAFFGPGAVEAGYTFNFPRESNPNTPKFNAFIGGFLGEKD